MKLSTWARQNGVSYRTARRWHKNGTLPVPAKTLETGTIFVYGEESAKADSGKVGIYSRVSSRDQAEDLARQTSRLKDFCAARGLIVSQIVEEIGSGLNGRRKRLLSVLGNPGITTLVVENRDRLARFGFDFIETSLKAAGRNIIVMCDEERTDDLVADFTDLATSMCARIYGNRSAKNRALRAVKAAESENS